MSPSYGAPVFSPPSPLTIAEGGNQVIQPQGTFHQVQWRHGSGQALPSGIYQNGTALQITNARLDQSGIYYCELYGENGQRSSVPYEIGVRPSNQSQSYGGKFARIKSNSMDMNSFSGGPPRISFSPTTINLKEGQSMIIEYRISVS